jgi:hypothetical protein
MWRGLSKSAWLGSQAFSGATAFNANIGAWNTARIAKLASVSPHCHRLHGWRTGCCLGVCRPRCCLDAHSCRAGTRRRCVLCRTLRRSLISGHLRAAVRGLGAYTCRARTRWYCVRGWHALCDMLRCCCSSAFQLTGLAWDAVLLGHASRPRPKHYFGHVCSLSRFTFFWGI